MLEIALVSDEHDSDVLVSVIAQLLQPARNVLVSLVLCDIVN